MSVNLVSLTGNIVKDAELSQTDAAVPVLNFTIAVTDRHFDHGKWNEYTNFFDLNIFGGRAKSLEKYCVKGTRVAVGGKLRQSTWEKGGRKRSRVVVRVDEIDFLSRLHSNTDDEAEE